jgi:hypothetical protein
VIFGTGTLSVVVRDLFLRTSIFPANSAFLLDFSEQKENNPSFGSRGESDDGFGQTQQR